MGLLNVDGYYNALLSFIDKAVAEGFITPAARNIIVSAQTAQELIFKLEVYTFYFTYSTNHFLTPGNHLFPVPIHKVKNSSLNEGLQAQALRS